MEDLESGASTDTEAGRLRKIERQVRLHLAQIRTEELTATLAHRRFLDQLLDMTTLNRQHGELDAQLEAPEKLTDWFNERAHQESDRRRQVLLAAIAVFGLFEVGTFLSVGDTTGLFVVGARRGVWEVWVMVGVFVFGVLLGVGLFSKRVGTWLNRRRAKARLISSGRPAGDHGGNTG